MAKQRKTQENTHDKLFKQTFSQVEVMRDYIVHFLPKPLAKGLDLDSLELDNGEYVDGELKEHFSDLVYHCRFGKQKFRIALLLEHKSSQPKYPHLQLLRYMLNIWERNLSDKRELTPIVPIVIYHGKTKWKTKPLRHYFKGLPKPLHPYLPDFEYHVTDLNVVTNQEIIPLHRTALYNVFLAFKHIRSRNRLLEHFPLLFANFEQIGENQAYVLLVYITKNTELEGKDIRRAMQGAINQNDNVMTTYDKIIKWAAYKKALETVKVCHADNLPVENAARYAGLPLEEVRILYDKLDKGERIEVEDE